MSGIRSLVLDLDDTLVASARARQRGRRVLARRGIAPRAFASAERRWWKVFEDRQCTVEEMRAGRWQDFGLSREEALMADAEYRAIAGLVHLRRGATSLIKGARAAGLGTAILTNGTAEPQLRKIAAVGLDRLVDAVVVTEQVGLHKPRPEPFLHALALIGGEPAAAAMVGDTLYADVAGALGAGFARVFWVGERARRHEDPRVVTIRRLAEVLPACG